MLDEIVMATYPEPLKLPHIPARFEFCPANALPFLLMGKVKTGGAKEIR